MTRRFPHHKLIVFERSLELAEMSVDIQTSLPVKFRHLGDQLFRSGTAVSLLIAEGANRYSAAQRRQRFIEARGECGEAAATVEMLARFKAIEESRSLSFHNVADEVAAMLCGLIRRNS